MKRNLVKAAALMAVPAMLLAGCGSDTGNDSKAISNTQAVDDGHTQNGETDTSVLKDGEDTELLVVFPGASSAPASLAEVENQINAIVKETMDAHVKLQIIEWGAMTDQYNLMLSSGEKVDLMLSCDTKNYALRGQLQDIQDLVKTYAPGAYEVMSQYIDACYVDGGLYGLPTFHDLANAVGLCCRTDILDAVGVDPETVKTWDDVAQLLDKVDAKYPDMNLLVPSGIGQGIMSALESSYFEVIEAGVGVVFDTEGTDIVNVYETDEFRKICQMAADWNSKGYFMADSVTNTETRESLIKAGNSFGYIANIYPGFENQESTGCNTDMTCISIEPAKVHTASVTAGEWVVPTACENPAKALAFLDLLYTNEDVQNLFFYGIEGTDYVLKDEAQGIIAYPEGKDASSVGWINQTWLTGNGAIAYKWESQDPQIWTKLKEFNDTAKKPSIFGFVYDTSNVKNEITAIKNVQSKYLAILESGEADVDSTINEFLNELESAGIQDLVTDMQQQLSQWQASKK